VHSVAVYVLFDEILACALNVHMNVRRTTELRTMHHCETISLIQAVNH